MAGPAEALLANLMRRRTLPPAYARTVETLARPLCADIAGFRARLGRCVIVGLCGSQGSGKSTLTEAVAILLQEQGLSAAVLSLDDLYLPPPAREQLAATVHPLLRTRGPPGTHDVALGAEVLDALVAPGPAHPVRLPRFDKAADAPAPKAGWPQVQAPVDVVLFEGWCVGALPQDAAALETPVNALERDEDGDGRWRRYVNAELAGDYQRLFARLDRLVLLQAPSFERVLAWRTLQEETLATRLAADGAEGHTMEASELRRFVQHYERLTRHILAEMPARADVVARLGPDHEVEAVAFRHE